MLFGGVSLPIFFGFGEGWESSFLFYFFFSIRNIESRPALNF